MMDLDLEWDEAKRIGNLAKHKVDFEGVRAAFYDGKAQVVADARTDYGEDRLIMTARCGGDLLVIVYTPRGKKIRIISARFASARERARYECR